jgi:hypothetical protein
MLDRLRVAKLYATVFSMVLVVDNMETATDS